MTNDIDLTTELWLRLGDYSAVVANWIDESEKSRDLTWFGFIYNVIKIRCIFVSVYLPLLVFDIAVNLILSISNFLLALVTSDDTQKQCFNHSQHFAFLFSKHVIALSLSWLGLMLTHWFSFNLINHQIVSPEDVGFSDFTSFIDMNKNDESKLGVFLDEHELVVKDEEELKNILAFAKKEGLKVMAKGAGKSQGNQFKGVNCITLNMKNFNAMDYIQEPDSQVIASEDDHRVIRVGAGVVWRDLQTKIDNNSRAIYVMQASGIFSVGGSIGQNCHGWNPRLGPISNTVQEMRVMKADGCVQTLKAPGCVLLKVTDEPKDYHKISKYLFGRDALLRFKDKIYYVSRDNKSIQELRLNANNKAALGQLFTYQYQQADAEAVKCIEKITGKKLPKEPLWDLVAGGMGLNAIILDVKLSLTDNEYLKRTSEIIPVKDYAQYYRENVRDNNDIRMSYLRLSLDSSNLLGKAFTETFELPEKPSGPMSTPKLTFEDKHGTRFQRIMMNFGNHLSTVRAMYWHNECAEYQQEQPIATTNQIMQAPINVIYNGAKSESVYLQEYFIPLHQFAAFTEELGHVLTKNQVALLNASARPVPKHEGAGWSYAAKNDMMAVVLCFNQSLREDALIKMRKWIRQAQQLAVDYDGAYYLPYQHVSNPQTFKASYPHAQQAFDDAKKKYDPNKLLYSGFADKFLTEDPLAQRVEFARKVVLDDKLWQKFSVFIDKNFQLLDSEPTRALLKDILEYTDTHAEFYAEFCKRLPEIAPGFPFDVSRKLSALAAIKKDIGAQAKELWENSKAPEKIEHIIEVGSPARYVQEYAKFVPISGQVTVFNEGAPSTFGDWLQGGSWGKFLQPAYHQHHVLNYDAADLWKDMAEKSTEGEVSLVTCYVGLHHFSEPALDAFLTYVRKVLKKDGRFLLVDHAIDKKEDDIHAMADLAHLIFNAATGETLAYEQKEIRDFKPIADWLKILEKHQLINARTGFKDGLLTRGSDKNNDADPTRNAMLVFKPEEVKAEQVSNWFPNFFKAAHKNPVVETLLDMLCPG